jgi:hypothetical protein
MNFADTPIRRQSRKPFIGAYDMRPDSKIQRRFSGLDAGGAAFFCLESTEKAPFTPFTLFFCRLASGEVARKY